MKLTALSLSLALPLPLLLPLLLPLVLPPSLALSLSLFHSLSLSQAWQGNQNLTRMLEVRTTPDRGT